MEKEKKGLFGRLMDFWKERIGTNETDSIGFWNDTETAETPFAEPGALAALTQTETKKAFWEETAETVLSVGEPEHTVLALEKKMFLAETEEKREEAFGTAEESEQKSGKKEKGLFATEVFKDEMRKTEKSGENGFSKAFLWEMPEEDRKETRSFFIEKETEQEKWLPKTEIVQEMHMTEPLRQEEKRAEPQIDIEKLMRQITKRLWEERESCGRRLR